MEGDLHADYNAAPGRISIHALRVEGDLAFSKRNRRSFISIHALRVEGDLERVQRLLNHSDISIHALRVEGDLGCESGRSVPMLDFYPRPPGGGRLDDLAICMDEVGFLSTPSGWRATTRLQTS